MRYEDNADRIADVLIIIAFITIVILRIIGIITWPWIWILAPIWGLLGIGFIGAIIFLIIYNINNYIQNKRRKKNERY